MREFWERGYRDTSVDDLVEATGVRPGSLYNAFPGGKRAGLAELRAYFDGLVLDLTTREGQMGCLMVNSAVELAAEDSEVGEVVRGHMARLERNAERALRNAKRRGAISAGVNPRAKAIQLMATGMGLMVVGKTDPGKKVLETIVDSAFADL